MKQEWARQDAQRAAENAAREAVWAAESAARKSKFEEEVAAAEAESERFVNEMKKRDENALKAINERYGIETNKMDDASGYVPTYPSGPVRVKGYIKRDGTSVKTHYRSRPDGTRANNWSTKGNYNPFTGKRGSRR